MNCQNIAIFLRKYSKNLVMKKIITTIIIVLGLCLSINAQNLKLENNYDSYYSGKLIGIGDYNYEIKVMDISYDGLKKMLSDYERTFSFSQNLYYFVDETKDAVKDNSQEINDLKRIISDLRSTIKEQQSDIEELKRDINELNRKIH